MKAGKGFTITELLIVVAIIGILTAVAFPSYQNHVRKAARADAQAELMRIADREAQYMLDARTYAIGPTALATLSETLPSSVAAKYSVAVHAADGTDAPSAPPSYLIVATPIAGGPQAPDGDLSLSSTGAKTHAGSPSW